MTTDLNASSVTFDDFLCNIQPQPQPNVRSTLSFDTGDAVEALKDVRELVLWNPVSLEEQAPENTALAMIDASTGDDAKDV